MPRLKCRYVYTVGGMGVTACFGTLVAAAATQNLELAMLGAVTFFGCLAIVLVALAFEWLDRGRRIQDRVDVLEQERAKYHAARAFLDVEAERAVSANEARELKAAEVTAEERAAMRQEYDTKLSENVATMDNTRTKEVKEAWLLGFKAGQSGLTEDAPEAGGILIPWPLPVPQGDTTKGAGRNRN
jgi:hypothetical protein